MLLSSTAINTVEATAVFRPLDRFLRQNILIKFLKKLRCKEILQLLHHLETFNTGIRELDANFWTLDKLFLNRIEM